MKLLKPAVGLALTYCILGPVLFYTELSLMKASPAHEASSIALIAVFFFAYSLLSLALFHHTIASNSKFLTNFYLIDKVVRLFFSILLLVGYRVLSNADTLLFAVNLFVFFLVTVIFTTSYCVRVENKLKVQK